GVAVGQLAADAAQLTLDGNAARHTLQARLTSAGGEALATLNGGLNNGVWRGELTRFAGRDRIGPWALTAPARLQVSAAGFAVSPLVLQGLPGERMELAGQL